MNPYRRYLREVLRCGEYLFAPSLVTFAALMFIVAGSVSGNGALLWTGVAVWAVTLVLRMVEMIVYPELMDAWFKGDKRER